MCIPERMEYNSLCYCIDSNQILFHDEYLQVHNVACHIGAKYDMYDCIVSFTYDYTMIGAY